MDGGQWSSWRRGIAGWWCLVAGAAAGVVPAAGVAGGQAPEPDPAAFSVVLQRIVLGDLVMAGASNVVPADARRSAADIDDDATTLCVARTIGTAALCDDNSSSALLDLPPGASVLAARLYVSASVAPSVGPLRARLAGPEDAAYTELSPEQSPLPYVGERSVGSHRQAIWDVTELVRQRGGGVYIVADVVSEAARPDLPYTAWTIVAAYELGGGVELGRLTTEEQTRFARRSLSWHDGLATTSDDALEVEVSGFAVPTDRPVFAKSFHLAAHGGEGGYENVLFGGDPIGNNLTPGDAAAPAGVVLGTDPACNSTVDVLNHSICNLGTPVGPQVGGSTIDMDVVRVPDRYLVAGATSAVVSVPSNADVAVGLVAVSVDQPAEGRVR